jgi:hypothetical protein
MNSQLDLFETLAGIIKPVTDAAIRRDGGIQRAVDHANYTNDGWSDAAYSFFLSYITRHQSFMTEEVRAASYGIVPEPPSLRAWGAVIVRAAREGLIRRIGYQQVKNANAHMTPAALWGVIKNYSER